MVQSPMCPCIFTILAQVGVQVHFRIDCYLQTSAIHSTILRAYSQTRSACAASLQMSLCSNTALVTWGTMQLFPAVLCNTMYGTHCYQSLYVNVQINGVLLLDQAVPAKQ